MIIKGSGYCVWNPFCKNYYNNHKFQAKNLHASVKTNTFASLFTTNNTFVYTNKYAFVYINIVIGTI